MAYQGVGKRYQSSADASYIHDEAGENEQGDRQHGKRVHAGHNLLRDNHEG